MASRVLKARVSADAAEVIERLADESGFPGHTEDIVSVTDLGDGSREWVLAFRGSTARWVQRSRGAEPYRIEFEQVSGDWQSFGGAWESTPLAGGGCELRYEVHYRTSVPHLAGAIDSAVGRVLARSAHRIMCAVAGPAQIVEGGYYLQDHPQGSLAS